MGGSKLRTESKDASKRILNKQRRTNKVALSFGSVIFISYICIVNLKQQVMSRNEILKMLNGCEVNSLEFEGVVGINNGNVFRDGEKLELTDEDVQTLWEEYVEGEGLY